MKLIIDIDEDTYRYMQSRCKYQNKGDKGLSKFEKAGVAIKNGTPLPKGHGRLIDADVLKKIIKENDVLSMTGFCVNLCDINNTPTIIEADKAERSEE